MNGTTKATDGDTRLKLAQVQPEKWLCWRQLKQVEGEDAPRLLIPHSNPQQYETEMNGLFKTEQEAYQYLQPYGAEHGEQFVLCEVTMTPRRVVTFTTPQGENDDTNITVEDNDTNVVVHLEPEG